MSKCRSCGAEIRWLKTPGGKNMPCDPVKVNGDGSVERLRLVRDDGSIASNPGPEISGYVPHWATCPSAEEHRRQQ